MLCWEDVERKKVGIRMLPLLMEAGNLVEYGIISKTEVTAEEVDENARRGHRRVGDPEFDGQKVS